MKPLLTATFALLFSLASYASEITIYTAQSIITMEPSQPRATAVAVQNGLIVGVGTEASLMPWVDRFGGKIDRQLEDMTVMPGFIDPHVHPSLPAILTQLPFLAPDDWSLPTGEFPGALTPEDYKSKLIALEANHADRSKPFGSWGYHELWHGHVRRAELDAWFGDRPVFIWQRSFHEVIFNTAALDHFGITQADAEAAHGEANWDEGHFWENGLFAVFRNLGYLIEPHNYMRGTQNFLDMAHQGGVTTAVDMGLGISSDPDIELQLLSGMVQQAKAPLRLVMTPIISKFMQSGKTPEQALEQVKQWQQTYTGQVSVRDHFKLMVDGAIFSALAQFKAPGYLDGHEGVWLVPEAALKEYAEVFWRAGFQLHAHSNGDAATERTLDLVESLLTHFPRRDHSFTIEHFAYATSDQAKRIKAIGVIESANPYYHYILSDSYGEHEIGPSRAEQMVRLGTLERLGVPFTLHSDTPMAPLKPLTLAWNASNRQTINGHLTGQNERVSLDAALRAITIDAAWAVGMETEIGSIAVGKKADFTVLAQDPYEVGASGLKDIEIRGTIFEGRFAPVH